jgi:hypothetical protein
VTARPTLDTLSPDSRETIMATTSSSRSAVLAGYLAAYGCVVEAGFEKDIQWAKGLASVEPDDRYVMCEGAWVIVNSGFRYNVARKLWPELTRVFWDFDPHCIGPEDMKRGLKVLRHERKIHAIIDLAALIHKDGVASILEDAKDPPKLTRLPYIGPITCWHLAKVLGVDAVKPDVHLQRAATAAGYPSPLALCEEIRTASGDRLTVIDSVLWRYGQQQQERRWLPWDQLFKEAT